MLRRRNLLAILVLLFNIGYANAQSENVSRAENTDVPRATVSVTSPEIGTTPVSLGDVSKEVGPKGAEDPTTNYEVFEDFLHGSNFTSLEKINQLASAGGGSGQGWFYGQVYEDAWGVIEAQHGTGPSSRLDLVGKTNNMHAVAVGIGTAYEYQVRFNFASLSNPTNRYVTFDGFFDGDTVDPEFNRGILFRYSDDTNDGRFEVVVREAPGEETLVDTGVEPEADTWYRLKVVVNASGSEALFFINDEQVAVVTTNLAIGRLNRYTAESNTDRMSGNMRFVSRRFDYVRFRAMHRRTSRL
ncbi:MAG: hypothetical protein ABI857_10695 [Acidobacteriota bacterium]